MSISLVTWPSRSLSSKCFFRARLDDCYDPVIFLSLGVFCFGTMESRFVFLLSPFSRPIGLFVQHSVCRKESVFSLHKIPLCQLRSIAVGDDIPPPPAKCGTEGFRPSSSSDS